MVEAHVVGQVLLFLAGLLIGHGIAISRRNHTSSDVIAGLIILVPAVLLLAV